MAPLRGQVILKEDKQDFQEWGPYPGTPQPHLPSGFGGLLGTPDQGHRKEATCVFPLGPVVWMMGLRPFGDQGLGYRCQLPQAAQETRRPAHLQREPRSLRRMCSKKDCASWYLCPPSLWPPSRMSSHLRETQPQPAV